MSTKGAKWADAAIGYAQFFSDGTDQPKNCRDAARVSNEQRPTKKQDDLRWPAIAKVSFWMLNAITYKARWRHRSHYSSMEITSVLLAQGRSRSSERSNSVLAINFASRFDTFQ